MGPLFIPQVIYEHGETWWNDIDRGKLLRLPEISGNPMSSHLVAKQKLAKEIMNLALQSIFVHTSKVSSTCCKIFQHGATGFTSPLMGSVLWTFIALKHPSFSAGFEPANPGSNGKHVNHYTTEDTKAGIYTVQFICPLFCLHCPAGQ
jgi:hypothetical protein